MSGDAPDLDMMTDEERLKYFEADETLKDLLKNT